MKKKSLTFFLLLFICSIVYAQNKGTIVKAQTVTEYDHPKKLMVPAYVLDGALIYDFKNLNPDNIFDVRVFKGAGDTAKFGKNAVNGVVLIIAEQFIRKKINDKLSLFSESLKYCNIEEHLCRPTYILNDSISDERTIYYLPKEKIRCVKFIASETNSVIKIKSDKLIK